MFNYLKVAGNLLRQHRNQGLHRIGYMSLKKEYYLRLPELQFVPLNIEMVNISEETATENRKEMYDSLVNDFIDQGISLKQWEVINVESSNSEFIKLFLAYIIRLTNPILCDKYKLHAIIESCRKQIQKKSVEALFSVGGWFRIEHAIIAAEEAT